MAWTTSRSLGIAEGGHFFASHYGIRIQAASNTLVIWKPTKPHGTSLQNLDPRDPSPQSWQSGMSIVTSNRIEKIWNCYWDGMLEASDSEEGELYV